MRRRFALSVVLGMAGLQACSPFRRGPAALTHAQRIGLGPVHDKETDVFRPGVGGTATTTVGTTMVSHTRVRVNVAMQLKAAVLADGYHDKDYRLHVPVPPGEFRIGGRDRAGNEYFNLGPLVGRWIYRGAFSSEEKLVGDLKVTPAGAASLMWAYPYETEFQEIPLPTAQVVRSTTFPVETEPSFRRELVYTGRSGSTLNLLYREFKDDMARPAFTQALQYDILADPVIGYQVLATLPPL